jgi:hypothetical protein
MSVEINVGACAIGTKVGVSSVRFGLLGDEAKVSIDDQCIFAYYSP